jgi:hypothetical protein
MPGVLESILVLTSAAGTVNSTMKQVVGVGVDDVVIGTLGSLISSAITDRIDQSSHAETQRINQHLQRAFRWDVASAGAPRLLLRLFRQHSLHIQVQPWQQGRCRQCSSAENPVFGVGGAAQRQHRQRLILGIDDPIFSNATLCIFAPLRDPI